MNIPVIEMHLRELGHLVNSLDHSPCRDRELDSNAVEYIVRHTMDLHSGTAYALVIYMRIERTFLRPQLLLNVRCAFILRAVHNRHRESCVSYSGAVLSALDRPLVADFGGVE